MLSTSPEVDNIYPATVIYRENIMANPERAEDHFLNDFNCAQSVLSVFCEEMNLPEETGLKIACGFGGGMSRYSRTCGAVTGGIMAISLKHGRTRAEDSDAQEKTYAAVQEFVRRFEEINESSICRDLIDCDLNTPEGLNKAHESGITKTLCPKLVKSAVEILNDILK